MTRRWRGWALAGVATALLLALLAACSSASHPTTAAIAATATTPPTTASATAPTTTPSAPAAVAAPQPAVEAPASTLPVVPLAHAEPTARFPAAPAAVGPGANAAVTTVPGSEWSRMVGYSWTPGCPVGRSGLRMVRVNYWGFDGVRHRGSLVVASSIASRTASAFTRLYDLRFRIRVIRPMDSGWGHNPKGPGADDYAAMRADNTSAFNCRYVGGEESRKVWSNHAYGRAIDVNDFENPYVASNGTVYPSPYFLHRRHGDGVLSSSRSSAVRAFTRLGFRWGGLWSDPDLQHLEIS